MDRDEVGIHKRSRPISSHLDRTNLVNKGFIIWLLVKFCLRDAAGGPERARSLHLARSGSQSQRAVWFILSARGASHLIKLVIGQFVIGQFNKPITCSRKLYILWIIDNRTSCRPFQSVIILVINKSDSRRAIVRFCYHSYDYRPNWIPLSPINITYDDDDDDDDDVELIQLRGFPGVEISSQVFIPRLQPFGTFLRIYADPSSAEFCIVLVRSLIPNCSKWPASFFDT